MHRLVHGGKLGAVSSRPPRVVRWIARSAIVLVPLYALFLAGMFVVMRQPPERFGQIMAHLPMPMLMIVPFETMWNVALGGQVQVGEVAPDFTLPRTDHSADVTLSSFRGSKPVVLVFGSYT
jgi:protein gp37